MTEEYIEELIRKYSTGKAHEDEIRKLMDWYRDSPEEVQWISDDPEEKQRVHDRMLDRIEKEIFIERGRVVPFPWAKIAAILVLVFGIAAFLVYYKPFSPDYLTVINPPGKIQQVELPDGSRVLLNANSTLRYAENFDKDRSLELAGEAYFNVTLDRAHPFQVKTGDVETTVLGTSFNIKAYPSQPSVTVAVIEGKVRVDNEEKELGLLTPARKLDYSGLQRTASISTIDTNYVLAWKKGRLQFEGEPFSQIAAALEHWYGVKILLSKPGISNCRYYMSFDNTTALDTVLTTMMAITEMQYLFDKNTKVITISGKECR